MGSDEGVKARAGAKSTTGVSSKQKPEVISERSKQFSLAPMLTLLFFSTGMLVLPLLTYFGIRQFIVNSTTISAMGAIVMVQVIVAVYIYKAWHEENKEHQTLMKEKLKKR